MQKFDFLKSIISSQKIVEPACGEQDIVVTIFVRCMCMQACMCMCICSSIRIVWVITSTFMH